MRIQAEEDLDQLLIFDLTWYQKALEKEPQMKEILDEVCVRLGLPAATIRDLLQHKIWSQGWKEARSRIGDETYV